MRYYLIGLTTWGDTAPVYQVTFSGANPHSEFAKFFARHPLIDAARIVGERGNALYEGEAGEGDLSCACHPVRDDGARLDFSVRTGKARLRPVGELVEVDGPDARGCYVALPADNDGQQYGAWVRRTR